VIVVVATTPDEVDAVRGRLVELGSPTVDVVATSDVRQLVLASVADDCEAELLVATLRSEGRLVVARPDSGVQLESWKRHTEPITFGHRLCVCFAWSEHDRAGLPPVVELGAGGFGNGEHPATRLVIEVLVDRIAGGERVLDVGCGSGVLGLCAMKLGASDVTAVDIKPEAVEATRRNAAINGMERRVAATDASLTYIDDSFDVVVANIGRAAIVELAPHLVRLVAPHGWLAISGISPSQCEQVGEFLRPLVELERRTSGEWSCVELGHHHLA